MPFSAAAFLLLFSLTFFHPHYAIWLVPFLALTVPLAADAKRLTIYHAIQVVCVLIYSAQWGAWTTWNLLEPLLGARVASLPDPVEAIDSQIEPRLFFGLFRSILSAVSLWMAWKTWAASTWRPVMSLSQLSSHSPTTGMMTSCSSPMPGYCPTR